MALDPSTNATMSGKITPPDAAFPYGSAKDETAPGNNDGTPYFKARADDIFGYFQSLLAKAGVVPNGSADSVSNPQYLTALEKLFERTNTIYISADQTYNPPAGVKRLKIEAQGAGGGGGGVSSTEGLFDQAAISTGGGGGGYVMLDSTTIETGYDIVIGAAGAEGADGGGDGGNGGDTTVDSSLHSGAVLLTAEGGGGGNGETASSSQQETPGAQGGDASGGTINAQGGGSGRSSSEDENIVFARSVSGGSHFGPGIFGTDTGDGIAAKAPGVGGAGCFNAGSAAQKHGGEGGPGIVVITEYYGQL